MSDFPYVAPPVDGLRLAMADARGRRYRKAGLSSATAASALMVVLAVLGGSGTQSLVQQPAPEQPAISQLVPGPADAAPGTPNTVGAVSAAGPARFGALTPAGLSAPGGTPVRGDGSRTAAGAAAPALRSTTGPMQRSAGSPPVVDVCPVDKTASGNTNLCPTSNYRYVYDDQSRVIGYDLVTSVCSYDTSTVTLHFADTVEADVAVLDSKGHALWRWSAEHAALPSPHTLAMSTGDCWEWTTRWAEVDQTGHKLPAGSYTLRVTSFARELGTQNVSETTFQL